MSNNVIEISNIYQLWIGKKNQVHVHLLGSSLDESTPFDIEKHQDLLSNFKVTRTFITSKIDFDVEKMKEVCLEIPAIKNLDLSVVEPNHEGYMGDWLYCIRIEAK